MLGLTCALLLLLSCVWIVAEKFGEWKKLEGTLQRQGIRGPPGNPWLGGVLKQVLELRASRRAKELHISRHNSEIVQHVLPDYVQFSKEYGVPYYYWLGRELTLAVSNPEIARDVLSRKANACGRSPAQEQAFIRFVGRGVLSVSGDEWVHHRRVVSPAFLTDKLKGMTTTFTRCTSEMLDKWATLIQQSSEIDVKQQFSVLTAEIISHTGFGSSYAKGKRVFEIQNLIGGLLRQARSSSWIPFYRHFPTTVNRNMRSLEKEVDGLLLQLINQRRESVKNRNASSYGDDLLGLILAESEADTGFDDIRLVGECRTFYIAGQETTATLLTWATFLLAIHPEWQCLAREEVREACKEDGNITPEVLPKLKKLGMILNETLRLYPPAFMITRCCYQDMQLGDLRVPRGAIIEVHVLAMHHDKQLWGPDADQFNPQRFANGVSNAAKHPNAFMPFSFGPRICVGQSFALMEAKVVMAMLLRRFSFTLSPNYSHCPTIALTVTPKEGMQVILTKL